MNYPSGWRPRSPLHLQTAVFMGPGFRRAAHESLAAPPTPPHAPARPPIRHPPYFHCRRTRMVNVDLNQPSHSLAGLGQRPLPRVVASSMVCGLERHAPGRLPVRRQRSRRRTGGAVLMARGKNGMRNDSELNPAIENRLNGGDEFAIAQWAGENEAPTPPGPQPIASPRHSLASGSFTQNWSGTDALMTGNAGASGTAGSTAWDLVPGIVGYSGNGLTAPAGTDPQTILGTSALISLLGNSTTGNSQGGFHEIANDTIAFQGSVNSQRRTWLSTSMPQVDRVSPSHARCAS